MLASAVVAPTAPYAFGVVGAWVEMKLRAKLCSISASTIDRLLAPDRARLSLSGRPGTKPGTLLKHQIPVKTFSEWDDARPGFVEIDLVGHEGGVLRGEYCQTLDVTDVETGWTETRAVKNKAQVHVFAARARRCARHTAPSPPPSRAGRRPGACRRCRRAR
ncbi:MAG: hypothetical protein WBI63_09360 [Coriobacteriia bacterium]